MTRNGINNKQLLKFLVPLFCIIINLTYIGGDGVGEDVTNKKDWKKKDIRDYRYKMHSLKPKPKHFL